MIKKRWLLSLLCLLLVACQQEAEEPAEVSSIQVIGANGSMTLDENRVVMTLRDGYEYVTNVAAVNIQARDIEQAGDPVVWEGTATGYNDYEVPYWVFYPELPRTGSWIFDVEIQREGGEKVISTLGANFWEAPLGLPVGAPAFPSETRTGSTEEELKAISTDTTPNPAYYQQTVAEAVSSGKPTLIAFATPGLCKSEVCAPVMNTVDALYEQYQDQMNFVHVEVHSDFTTLAYVPAMGEWELVNEPWLYVIDADGMIAARFDGPVSPQEITPALEDVVNAS